MYLDKDNIQTIQLDHTSRCNLACPQCARTYSGKLNPLMPITDLSLDDYKIILEPFDKTKIKIFHNGNYGDVLSSKTFDTTLDYCLDQGVKEIKISTNASLRTPNWWSNLAKKSKDRLKVVFAIDGLSDTNHIYRVNSNFNKIIENAKAFIDSGGYAIWNFIEFEHNYHQIDEAKRMSETLGFNEFIVKYTARFAYEKRANVETTKGTIVKQRENHNNTAIEEIYKEYIDFNDYVNNTKIKCKFQASQTIFIDMNMRLWPCCWMGAPEFFHHKNAQTTDIKRLFELYGNDFNNLRLHGWSILEHDFFKNYLNNSWNNPNNYHKRLFTCGRTCGEKFEFSSGYGNNRKVLIKG